VIKWYIVIQYNTVPWLQIKANRKQTAVKLTDFDIIMVHQQLLLLWGMVQMAYLRRTSLGLCPLEPVNENCVTDIDEKIARQPVNQKP